MFDIIFYKNRSEPNRVDKSPYLEFFTILTGTLRNSTSVINPSILIELIDKRDQVQSNNKDVVDSDNNKVIITEISDLVKCNYCYIPIFNRYYYINDIISVKNKLWEIVMSVDVLMSYKDKILEQSGIIDRNEFEFNKFLEDDRVPVLDYDVSSIAYASKCVIKIGDVEHNPDLFTYHVMVNTLSAKLSPYMAGSDLHLFSCNISNNTAPYFFENLDDYAVFCEYVLNPNYMQAVSNQFTNISDYIVSAKLCPINLKAIKDFFGEENSPVFIADNSPVIVGTVGVYDDDPLFPDGYSKPLILSGTRVRFWFTIDSGDLDVLNIDDFTKFEPHSKYSLFLPYIGIVSLPAQALYDNYDTVVYELDIVTGDVLVTLNIGAPIYGEPLVFIKYKWEGNMFIDLPFGRTNQAELWGKLTSLPNEFIQSGGGMGVYNIQKGNSMRTPKRKQISAKGMRTKSIGKMQVATAAANVANELVTGFASQGSVGGLPDNILKGRYYPIPFIVRYSAKFDYPDNYNHNYGRPLLKNKTLSQIHGYTEVSSIHLDGFNETTYDELDEIEDLLLDGVILP